MRVRWVQDNIYGVYRVYEDREQILFRGSLSDCEAYINLSKGGYI